MLERTDLQGCEKNSQGQ